MQASVQCFAALCPGANATFTLSRGAGAGQTLQIIVNLQKFYSPAHLCEGDTDINCNSYYFHT